MLTLSLYQVPTGNTDYYSQAFRNLIEDHKNYLLNHSLTKQIPLTPNAEDIYTGDFYQLLQSLRIEQDLWWIIMRLNGLHSPLDYTGNLGNIYVPDASVINSLNTRFMNNITLT